jgi:hypothetical protein
MKNIHKILEFKSFLGKDHKAKGNTMDSLQKYQGLLLNFLKILSNYEDLSNFIEYFRRVSIKYKGVPYF